MNDELLVLMGTDPRELSELDLSRMVRVCDAAALSRIVRDCDAAALSRIVRDCDAAALSRMVRVCDADALSRIVSDCDADALIRMVRVCDAAALRRIGEIKSLIDAVPVIKNPYTSILAAITTDGCSLDMRSWHTCETTHCLAGWTVHLAGPAGKAMEEEVSTPTAAATILRKSRPDAPLPNFYATDKAAMAFIEARAAEEANACS